jgi:hypothetical protein
MSSDASSNQVVIVPKIYIYTVANICSNNVANKSAFVFLIISVA